MVNLNPSLLLAVRLRVNLGRFRVPRKRVIPPIRLVGREEVRVVVVGRLVWRTVALQLTMVTERVKATIPILPLM